MSTTIGLLAGVLTTGCWLPQLLRSWRNRSTSDISWTYLAVLTAGVGLWIVYGALTADVAVVTTNVATSVALVMLATFKARFEGRSEKPLSCDPDRGAAPGGEDRVTEGASSPSGGARPGGDEAGR